MSNLYYIDTCIWLNLFKKEGDESKGRPYWLIAKEFIIKVDKNQEQIYISKLIIKELYFKLGKDFDKVKQFFKERNFINLVDLTSEDYSLARTFERTDNYKISFYDYLHVAISQRLDLILITRDKELINFSKKYIKVQKPEDQ